MAINAGQGTPGQISPFQQCPHCGTNKVYARNRVIQILEQYADNRVFPCENKRCKKPIYIGPRPALRLAKAQSSPTSKAMQRPSARVAQAAKPEAPTDAEIPVARTGDETITTAEVPDLSAVATMAKAPGAIDGRVKQIKAVRERLLAFAKPGVLYRDRYQFDKLVGEGATGIVFSALDVTTKQTVALKFHLETSLDDDEAQLPALRVTRAFDIQGKFTSPHVLHPIDLFSDPDYGFVTVEEYVPGTALGDLLNPEKHRDVSLSEEYALSVGVQIGSVLVQASKLGIVHRDIKPDNIMVQVRDDGKMFVHLVDFGLARWRKDSGHNPMGGTSEYSAEDLQVRYRLAAKEPQPIPEEHLQELSGSLTARHGPLGTARYMAPEQAEGATADERSDQYGLAATLYHLVTRQPPFPGSDPIAILRNVLNQELDPPHLVARRNGFRMSEAFSAVLVKAMSRNPEHRYATPVDFLEALRDAEALAKQEKARPPVGPATLAPAVPEDRPHTGPVAKHWVRDTLGRYLLYALFLAGVAGVVAVAVLHKLHR